MTHFLNPPFHPKMLTIGSPQSGSKQLQRGRIVTDPSTAGQNSGTGSGRPAVRFMYNPISVTSTHYNNYLLNTTGLGNSNLNNLDLNSGNNINIGSCSFSLLFDRTYEVYEGGHGSASSLGVYVDVLAFYQLLGITPLKMSTGKLSGAKVTETIWSSMYPTNAINLNYYFDIYIGDKMRFYGYVDNCTITYTHWSNKMIPMRCEVDIDLQYIVNSTSKSKKVKSSSKKITKVGGGHPELPGSNKQILPGG